MLKNNKIVKSKAEISKEDKYQISQILYYFSNTHELSDVKFLPKDFSLNDHNMKSTFGFPFENATYNNSPNNYFSFNLSPPINPIDINGFNYFIDMHDNQSTTISTDNKLKIQYDNQSTVLKIF